MQLIFYKKDTNNSGSWYSSDKSRMNPFLWFINICQSLHKLRQIRTIKIYMYTFTLMTMNNAIRYLAATASHPQNMLNFSSEVTLICAFQNIIILQKRNEHLFWKIYFICTLLFSSSENMVVFHELLHEC